MAINQMQGPVQGKSDAIKELNSTISQMTTLMQNQQQLKMLKKEQEFNKGKDLLDRIVAQDGSLWMAAQRNSDYVLNAYLKMGYDAKTALRLIKDIQNSPSSEADMYKFISEDAMWDFIKKGDSTKMDALRNAVKDPTVPSNKKLYEYINEGLFKVPGYEKGNEKGISNISGIPDDNNNNPPLSDNNINPSDKLDNNNNTNVNQTAIEKNQAELERRRLLREQAQESKQETESNINPETEESLNLYLQQLQNQGEEQKIEPENRNIDSDTQFYIPPEEEKPAIKFYGFGSDASKTSEYLRDKIAMGRMGKAAPNKNLETFVKLNDKLNQSGFEVGQYTGKMDPPSTPTEMKEQTKEIEDGLGDFGKWWASLSKEGVKDLGNTLYGIAEANQLTISNDQTKAFFEMYQSLPDEQKYRYNPAGQAFALQKEQQSLAERNSIISELQTYINAEYFKLQKKAADAATTLSEGDMGILGIAKEQYENIDKMTFEYAKQFEPTTNLNKVEEQAKAIAAFRSSNMARNKEASTYQAYLNSSFSVLYDYADLTVTERAEVDAAVEKWGFLNFRNYQSLAGHISPEILKKLSDGFAALAYDERQQALREAAEFQGAQSKSGQIGQTQINPGTF